MQNRDIQAYVEAVIAFAQTNGIDLTHLKLQKVLYYLQSWSLAYLDNSLFDDEPQAWVNGPVYPAVYAQFAGIKATPIVPEGAVDPDAPEKMKQALKSLNVNDEQRELLIAILEEYMPKSAGELVYQSHREQPWRQARKGLGDFESGTSTITHDIIRDYYQDLVKRYETSHA